MQVDLTPFLSARQGSHEFVWSLTLPSGPVAGLGRRAAVAREAPVRVTARGNAAAIRLDVDVSFVLECPCDRCLARVAWPVALQYEEVLSLRRPGEASGWRGAEPQAWVEEDGEGAPRPVAAGAFPVEDGLWQRLALILPVKLLCHADCRGLCPRCGADLNRAACDCRDPAPDPRLAVLAEWRERSMQGT